MYNLVVNMYGLLSKPWLWRRWVRAVRVSHHRRRIRDVEHVAWAQALLGRVDRTVEDPT